MLRYLTAGESHGPGLVAVVDGLPAGLSITAEQINTELARRQLGYGRGGRMGIEKDKVEILGGVRLGKSLGGPISLLIRNRDWGNWSTIMALEPGETAEIVSRPRPGHADLAGLLKMQEKDIRNIMERASARETVARVAVGALAKSLLAELNIFVISQVIQIGCCKVSQKNLPLPENLDKIDASPVRCFDDQISQEMVAEIEQARAEGDTLGGIFEIIVYNVPPGLGSYAQWDKKLDGRIAQAMVSIQAIKGVEFGEGFRLAGIKGSEAHDEIFYEPSRGFYRKTNRAGGIEAGMSNGEPLVLRAVMKPIPTLGRPLQTVDIETKQPARAFQERADICAVPSAAVIGEAVVAIEITSAVLEKCGGDSLKELKRNYEGYLKTIF